MTQEEKQLLLKDLCARLNAGVEVYAQYEPTGDWYNGRLVGIDLDDKPCFTVQFYKPVPYKNYCNIKEIKPYLRPMSSMTETEASEWANACNMKFDCEDGFLDIYDAHLSTDWLNAHHFDYRKTSDGKTMIEAGLALEAKEEMYKK